MPRILIAYDKTEGQTRNTSRHEADALSRNEKDVRVIDTVDRLPAFPRKGSMSAWSVLQCA
jgi:menaquinone-dependent protoporphyrinogen IX oxidase